ncbi:MAG: hypothetical protein QM756_18090 [Polyangiaceae bacterium]
MPPPVEERDSPTTDPNPGSTVSPASPTSATEGAEQTPSVIRPVEVKPTGASSDTLLSAPQVTREDLAFDERLSTAERNLTELMLRVERLERRPAEPEAD